MLEPDAFSGKIVAMVQFRDYIVLATEYSVYRIWHDGSSGDMKWLKILEKN